MTNDQKLEMFKMRLDHYSIQDISNKFGISKQRVHELLSCRGERAGRESNLSRCPFPVIRRYLTEERISYAKMAKKTGIIYATFIHAIQGEHDALLGNAIKISKVIGLPVEQVFSRADEDKPNG